MIELNPYKLNYIGPHLRPDAIDNSDLQESIATEGQHSPVSVFELDGKYYYETGKRRVDCCKELFIKVKCELMDIDDVYKRRKIDFYEAMQTMNEFLPGETILPDNYPVYYDYVYICDGKIIQSDIEGTVKMLKGYMKATEIRRCEIIKRQKIK